VLTGTGAPSVHDPNIDIRSERKHWALLMSIARGKSPPHEGLGRPKMMALRLQLAAAGEIVSKQKARPHFLVTNVYLDAAGFRHLG
jgi:hypothetical protein